MANISIDTVFNIELEFELALISRRIAAYAIDFGLMMLYMVSIKTLIHGDSSAVVSMYVGLDILVVSLPMLLYSLATELLLNGQTIGKKIMHIRVVSLDGGEPGLGQYILRWLTKFFEWPFLFGFVILSGSSMFIYAFITFFFGLAVLVTIAVSKKNQRLGDILAGTVVVNTRSSMTLSDTVFVDLKKNYQVLYPQVMQLSDNDINTIKNVLEKGYKKHKEKIYNRVMNKVMDVLKIDSNLEPYIFLNVLLRDYNYLATKEDS